ncbi:MAG: hypothetical protein R3B95_16545 [Nitrospirales bacterium]|nr:hypothetical protein [Nitrospirales bacterium]
MSIRNLTPDQYPEFYRFNQEIYPDRKEIEHRFKAQILNNPLLEEKSKPHVLLAHNKASEIVGQFLLMPFHYDLDGQRTKGFFGCDFFMKEDSKKGAAGAFLAVKALNGHRPYFTFDASETAKKIALSLKSSIIGELYKFLWLRTAMAPIRLARFAITGDEDTIVPIISTPAPPDELTCQGHCFERVQALRKWCQHPAEPTVLEFSRSLEFLNWRFMSNPEKYYFYRMQDQSNASVFFVVRRARNRGLNLLALVDYKVPIGDTEIFRAILGSVKSLARLLRCDGVITMSSHHSFDRDLKKSMFFKIGIPAQILTNAKLNFSKTAIAQRRTVFVTMADGDMDFKFYDV